MEAGPAFLRGPGRLRLHTYCFRSGALHLLSRAPSARIPTARAPTHVRPVRTPGREGEVGCGFGGEGEKAGAEEPSDLTAFRLPAFAAIFSRHLVKRSKRKTG